MKNAMNDFMNNIEPDITNQLEQMTDVLRHNLKKACMEIEEWKNTGVLVNGGVVRCAGARLTNEVFKGMELGHVESRVNQLAREYIIANLA